MSTKERKLEIIERVLHLSLDEELDVVESALETLAVSIPGEEDVPPMPARSAAELTARLAEARADIKAGRTFSHEEVIAMAQKWRTNE
jgi:hypothetical protein